MEAIVTVVIDDPKLTGEKKTGIDLFGRMSTDVNSKHKYVFINTVSNPDQAGELVVAFVKKFTKCPVRVSRVEMIPSRGEIEYKILPSKKIKIIRITKRVNTANEKTTKPDAITRLRTHGTDAVWRNGK